MLTGQEVAAVVRAANNETVTLSNPIHRGDRLILFLAGMGRTTPSIEAGVPAPASPRLQTVMPPAVTLGGTSLIIRSSSLAPGQIGVYQIEVEVPGSVPLGLEIPLTITQGDTGATVNVRVVDK